MDRYTFGGVQLTKTDYDILRAYVARGNCPYCHRTSLARAFGNDKKHMRKCAQLFTTLGKETQFWVAIRQSRADGHSAA